MNQTQDSATVQSNHVAHVLVSRKLRTSMNLSTNAQLTQYVLNEALQESDNEYFIIILKTDISYDDSRYNYMVEFLRIPNELLIKIKSHGYNNVIFYVGISENTKEAKILNGPPTIDMVQTTDYDGNLKEFVSNMVCL